MNERQAAEPGASNAGAAREAGGNGCRPPSVSVVVVNYNGE